MKRAFSHQQILRKCEDMGQDFLLCGNDFHHQEPNVKVWKWPIEENYHLLILYEDTDKSVGHIYLSIKFRNGNFTCNCRCTVE